MEEISFGLEKYGKRSFAVYKSSEVLCGVFLERELLLGCLGGKKRE